MPLSSPLNPTLFLASKFFFKLTKTRTCSTLLCTTMSASQDGTNPASQNTPINLQNYHIPVSLALNTLSKEMELARAMSASSRSSLFALSKFDVLYQDQWLIAVNKPQGVCCETVLDSVPDVLDCLVESSGHSEDTVVRPELHIPNRLDCDTSGVMVITKLHKVASKLVKAFTDHTVRKTYIALCIHSAPKWEKISIKSGPGRSKFGAFRMYVASDVGRSLPGGSTVKDTKTSVEVLSINGQGSFKEPSEFNNI